MCEGRVRAETVARGRVAGTRTWPPRGRRDTVRELLRTKRMRPGSARRAGRTGHAESVARGAAARRCRTAYRPPGRPVHDVAATAFLDDRPYGTLGTLGRQGGAGPPAGARTLADPARRPRVRTPLRRAGPGAVVLAGLLLTTLAHAQTAAGASGSQGASRPNILVFLADDMGWGQPGFNGGTDVATPSMDRIANEGVRLTQFYVQPVCSPTRGALLTGRYAWKNGTEVRTTIDSTTGMLRDERTIADALRDAGYATWMVGKWHLGQWHSHHLPRQRGFDHHFGYYASEINSFTHLRKNGTLDWHRNGRPVVEEGHATFLLADEAARLIERHDGSRPFFLYVPFKAVHVRNQPPAEYLERYRHLPLPRSQRAQRAMLKVMDVAMGRIMAALERKGALDDTLVVFLNDNGAGVDADRTSPYRGRKEAYYEGGIRVPAVMRWPAAIPGGSETDALLHVVDLFPTFAGLAGADATAGLPLDGLDAWAAISADGESPRREVVHSLKVIRLGDWKLIERGIRHYNWRSGSKPQLYNIPLDPGETRNLASSMPDKVAQLRARLAHHRPFAREGEPFVRIPYYPPVVYGAAENADFGADVARALEQREQGNLAPALRSVDFGRSHVELVYDEPLDPGSTPPRTAFRVVAQPGYRSLGVYNVGVSGSTVALKLEDDLAGGDTVGVVYEVPARGAIRDMDRLEAAAVTWQSATVSPGLSVADASAREGQELRFAVELDTAPTGTVSVAWETADGTAEAGADYESAGGTLAFAPGDRRRILAVRAMADAASESPETMGLRLSKPTGARLVDPEATGTITDVAPLTAHVADAPAAHAGKGTNVTVRIGFSEPVAALPRSAFDVERAALKRTRRVDGRRDLWDATIRPRGRAAVTVTLPATTDCDARGAVCTRDGRPLAAGLSLTMPGPEN